MPMIEVRTAQLLPLEPDLEGEIICDWRLG